MGISLEIETARFQSLVRAISINGLIEEPAIFLAQGHLKTVNRDIASVVASCSVFQEKFFNGYHVEEGEERYIAVNAEKLLKLTKQLSDDTVEIKIERDKMTIRTAQQKVKVPLIQYNEGQAKLPHFLREQGNEFAFTEIYPVIVKIPKLGRELEGLGEKETFFSINDSSLTVKQETVDGYLIEQKISDVETESKFSIVVDTSYLKGMFDSVICEEIELRLDRSLPLAIIDKTSDYQLVLGLALRVMEESTSEEGKNE